MHTLAGSLARAGHDVRALSLNPKKHHVEVAALPVEVTGLAPIEAVPIDTTVRPLPALRSLLSGGSYNVSRFFSKRFAARLAERLANERFDVVQLESLFMASYVPFMRESSRAVIALRALNVEHRIWERLALAEPFWLRHAYLEHLSRRLKSYEIETLSKVDAIVPVTEEDALAFRELGARVPIHVTPVGLDLVADEPVALACEAGRGLSLFFIGSLDWRPNVEGLEWFLCDVWPELRRRNPDLRFTVAGSHAPAGVRRRLEDSGVEFAGQVADAKAFMAAHDVLLVPLLSGGGMRVKIVEAMALGRPVVATPVGAEGIAAPPDCGLVVSAADEDKASAFLFAIESVARDRQRVMELGKAAAGFARLHYDADRGARELADFYRTLLPAP